MSVKFHRHGLEIVRGPIASSKGIGRDLILRFLQGVPGITASNIEHQIANLKSSGDYARIIQEVHDEILLPLLLLILAFGGLLPRKISFRSRFRFRFHVCFPFPAYAQETGNGD
jgi:hypothetical protein